MSRCGIQICVITRCVIKGTALSALYVVGTQKNCLIFRLMEKKISTILCSKYLLTLMSAYVGCEFLVYQHIKYNLLANSIDPD